LSRQRLIRSPRDGNLDAQPHLFSSERHDWQTPRELFDQLDAELDVCASAENTKCRHFFSLAQRRLEAGMARRLLDEPTVRLRPAHMDGEGLCLIA